FGHAFKDGVGHGDAELVLHELGVANAGQRPDAGKHWNPVVFNASQKLLKQVNVKDGLGYGIICARFHFVFKAPHFLVNVHNAGVRAHADDKFGPSTDGIAANIETKIQIVDNIDQANSIHVKYSGGVRIIAHLGRIAGDPNDIVHSHCVATKKLRLHAEHVAVTPGEVQGGFNPGLLLYQSAQSQITHTGGGARTVRDVDGVNTGGLEKLCSFHFLAEIN